MGTTENLLELLRGMYAAFGSGDPRAWTDHLADDALGIGTASARTRTNGGTAGT